MSEILLETHAFLLERYADPRANPGDEIRWRLTVTTADHAVVLHKAGMKRLYEVVVQERARIVP